jgi:hypothetical protein
MSDFLSSLVDRALSRADVIERRRPSLFEPLGGGGQLHSPAPGSLGFYDNEQAGEEPLAVAEAPAAPPAPASTPRTRRSESVEPPHSFSRIASAQSEPGGLTHPIPPAPPRLVETKFEREAEKPARQSRLGPRHQEPAALELPAPAPAANAVSRGRARPEQKRENESGDRRLREDHSISVSAKPPTTPVSPLPQPAARAPALPVRISPAIALKTAAQEPTIHVTIGRVEIRATTASPAPSRPARPAAPKLNLEDYLRSRAGGGK